MNLSKNEVWLLTYLDKHCVSPDQGGNISVDRHWNNANEAKTEHGKAIASGIGITSEQLEGVMSRLEQFGYIGKTRTSTSLIVWITAIGQDAVRTKVVSGHESAGPVRDEKFTTPIQRLDSLREELEGLAPYPWNNVESWIAKATPTMRHDWAGHFEDFQSVAGPPQWTALPMIFGSNRAENEAAIARTTAIEESSNRATAQAAKNRLIAFLDGLLDLPTTAAPTAVMSFGLHDPSMMRTLNGMVMIAGNIQWQLFGNASADECQGVRVQFTFGGRIQRRRALQVVQECLQQNDVQMLQRRGQTWQLNLNRLREEVGDILVGLDWATGIAIIEPEVEILPANHDGFGESTSVRFNVYKEEYILGRQQKIFLSHKGADKPLVRRFSSTLTAIGFAPWLDEDAMVAGTELERGILQGFVDSCAAVFFITPNFADEGYLSTEINYAISQKREKGERFAIITIVFSDETGRKGVVPALLKQYVWKEPPTELDALNEILRALPIEPGEPRWRV